MSEGTLLLKLVAGLSCAWIGITRLFVKKSLLACPSILRPPIVFWYAMSFAGTFGLLLALRDLDATLVFPFTGLTLVVILVGGWFWLGEPVSPMRVSAVSLILFGTFLLWLAK